MALSDRLFLDLSPSSENGFIAAEVNVSRCDVAQALVVALVVIVIDEGLDLTFEIAGQVIVFQQNTVLHTLMPPFDFSLGLRVKRCAPNMRHVLTFQPFCQIARDVTGSVVTEQTWHVANDGLAATRRRQRQFDRIGHVLSAHVRAEFPRDDVAAVVIQDRAEIIPTPADDLEVGEVRLPHLVDCRGFVFELIGRFDHYVIRRSDQVSCFENAIS